jgi:hypothetical protein
MSQLQPDGANQNRDLTPLDYKTNGDLKSADAEVSLVVGSASSAESFISSKQYSLLWRDADLNTMGATY